MQLIDINEYVRRARFIRDLTLQRPECLAALAPGDRTSVEDYYLAALDSRDTSEYRRASIKHDSRIETKANRAYEQLLVAAGISEMLIGQRT